MTQSENWLVTELIPRKLKIYEISRKNISILLKCWNKAQENILDFSKWRQRTNLYCVGWIGCRKMTEMVRIERSYSAARLAYAL